MNLVDDPWIPVLFADGQRAELGLREVFARAADIADVEGDAPHVRIALLRLLLAVLHRALGGPRDPDEWARTLWDGDAGLKAAVRYLGERARCFDLLDPERPFWQCPGLPEGRAKPAAVLVPALASGNNRVWFDHTSVRRPVELGLAEAARWLVALQMFDPGGLKTGIPSGRVESADSPLARSLVVMPEGPSVARTLALGCVLYDPSQELPFAGSAKRAQDDRPVWERPPPTPEPTERAPAGYVDWLTWPARRVRLLPDPSDPSRIDRVVITAGDRLHKRLDPGSYEQFVPETRSSAGRPFSPLRFDPDRAAWRSSVAVLVRRSGDGQLHRRPRVVEHLDRLVEGGRLPRDAPLPFAVGGLAARQAKFLAWGEERLSPRAQLLADEVAGEAVAGAVRAAEELLEVLERTVAKARGGRARPSNVAGHYFALLGPPFEDFLLGVSRDPLAATNRWGAALKEVVDRVWAESVPPALSAADHRRLAEARSELERRAGGMRGRLAAEVRARVELSREGG